jgi:hypothetical protein
MTNRLSLLVLTLLLSGCGIVTHDAFDPIATKADLDVSVEEDMAELAQKPAIEALQAGREHSTPQTDKGVLLPLCQRLETECQVKTIALLDEEEADQPYIYEIVVQLPADAAAQSKVLNVIREADAKFAGSIETSQGEKWLSLIVLEPDDIE